MKNYRKLVPLVLVIFMAVSWYLLVSEAVETEKEYTSYLSAARKNAEATLTKEAIRNYNSALKIRDEADIYVEVAEYYKNQQDTASYLSWCENFFETHPTEVKAFDCVLDAYYTQDDYASCFDILVTAQKRNITSDYMEKVAKEIEYVYKIDFHSFDDVGIYSSNYCAVKSGEYWGFVDRFGEQRISCRYLQVGCYTQANVVSVVNSLGEAYFLDKQGDKVMVSKEQYQSFGLFLGDMIAAKKEDDKYVYVDAEFQELFGNYDYASTMNYGVAAVLNGEDWFIIDTSGEKITKTSFKDIKLDEKNVAFRNGCLFAMDTSGLYVMLDGEGKQIGNQTYEDARVFAGDSYTAVKIGERWGFVDNSGKVVIEPKYEEARSFSNGLAAVKMNGKWGFIDGAGSMKIEPQFFDAKDFNEKGSCFINTGDKWQLLKLYRLNREG